MLQVAVMTLQQEAVTEHRVYVGIPQAVVYSLFYSDRRHKGMVFC